MLGQISGVRKNSLAEAAGIVAGDKLVAVDGVQVKDIIELSFYTTDCEVELELESAVRYILINIPMRIWAWSLKQQFLIRSIPVIIIVFFALWTK